MRKILLTSVVLLAACRAATAQQWAVDMFDHTSHDFGTVARGATATHRFTLENKYLEDVEIVSIRSSCKCTIPKITKKVLKTYEKTEIEAIIDTRGEHRGRKDATLTVVFSKPFPAQVQLQVYTFIRSDVVIQPGKIDFGSVATGSRASQRVAISYRNDQNWRNWQVVDIRCASQHFEARLTETVREAGRVGYDLQITLKENVPEGYLNEHLFLITNDPHAPSARVPLAVAGIVEASVAAQPVMLGIVAPGETVTRPLVVRGKAPFRVLGVSCADPRFKFNESATAKTVHLIPVTFTAGETAGKVSATITIQTDSASAPTLQVTAHAQVTEGSGGASRSL